MKDHRYGRCKFLMEGGQFHSIKDIFTVIPKTTVYSDLGVNFNRFDRALSDPSIFRMAELIALAKLFDVDPMLVVKMAYCDILKTPAKKQSALLQPKLFRKKG